MAQTIRRFSFRIPVLGRAFSNGMNNDSNKDLYKILGVDRKSADKVAIKSAYVSLAKKHHPDVNKDGDPSLFKEINMAYSILSNDEKKKEYDGILEQKTRAGSQSSTYSSTQDARRYANRDAYGGYYTKTSYKNSSFTEDAQRKREQEEYEHQERLRREFRQRQYKGTGWTKEAEEDERRRQMYEEILRRQREYEERARNEWSFGGGSKEDINSMEEEIMKHQEELMKKKLMAFAITFFGMYFIFNIVFKIYGGPEEVIVVDPRTGSRKVITRMEFEEAERLASRRHHMRQRDKEEQIRRSMNPTYTHDIQRYENPSHPSYTSGSMDPRTGPRSPQSGTQDYYKGDVNGPTNTRFSPDK